MTARPMQVSFLLRLLAALIALVILHSTASDIVVDHGGEDQLVAAFGDDPATADSAPTVAAPPPALETPPTAALLARAKIKARIASLQLGNVRDYAPQRPPPRSQTV